MIHANASQEAQRIVDAELDRWPDSAVHYGGQGDVDLGVAPDSAYATIVAEAARRYRARKLLCDLVAQRRLPRPAALPSRPAGPTRDPAADPAGTLHPLSRGLVCDAASLASGTLATLTGFTRYEEIDAVQGLFVEWCRYFPSERAGRAGHPFTWQEAWAYFWKAVRETGHDDPARLCRLSRQG